MMQFLGSFYVPHHEISTQSRGFAGNTARRKVGICGHLCMSCEKQGILSVYNYLSGDIFENYMEYYNQDWSEKMGILLC